MMARRPRDPSPPRVAGPAMVAVVVAATKTTSKVFRSKRMAPPRCAVCVGRRTIVAGTNMVDLVMWFHDHLPEVRGPFQARPDAPEPGGPLRHQRIEDPDPDLDDAGLPAAVVRLDERPQRPFVEPDARPHGDVARGASHGSLAARERAEPSSCGTSLVVRVGADGPGRRGGPYQLNEIRSPVSRPSQTPASWDGGTDARHSPGPAAIAAGSDAGDTRVNDSGVPG
jgi:hypothetical protein